MTFKVVRVYPKEEETLKVFDTEEDAIQYLVSQIWPNRDTLFRISYRIEEVK